VYCTDTRVLPYSPAGTWIVGTNLHFATEISRLRGYFELLGEPPCEGMSSGGGGSRRGFSSRAWSKSSFRPLSLIAF